MSTNAIQSPMTVKQYLEQNQGAEVLQPLGISHRRNIHFMIITDKYRSEKVALRDGYIEPGKPDAEAIGKGLDIPLKDFPLFVQSVNDMLVELQAKGKCPK